ncbi:MAG: hypothetical protein KBC46_03540 [Ferrovibrio sp.]|nr:hypothetical protein [Ferrovibrio sp.]
MSDLLKRVWGFGSTFFSGGAGLQAYLIAGLLGALLLVAGGAWLLHGSDQRALAAAHEAKGLLQGQLDETLATNGRIAAAFDLYRQETARGNSIAASHDSQRQARGAAVKIEIKEVYRDRTIEVPAGCPALSPVLDDALNRLRRLRAAEADPGRPGPARPDTRDLAALRQ